MYTVVQKFGVDKIFYCFWKKAVMLTKDAFTVFDQGYSKNSNIMEYYKNLK